VLAAPEPEPDDDEDDEPEPVFTKYEPVLHLWRSKAT
jgi:hypothetical protein